MYEAAREREVENRKKLKSLTAKVHVLQQDSILLQKVSWEGFVIFIAAGLQCRAENAGLQKRILELKSLLRKCGATFIDTPIAS